MSHRTEGFDAKYTQVTLLSHQDDRDIPEGQMGLALSANETALFIGTRADLRSLLLRALFALPDDSEPCPPCKDGEHATVENGRCNCCGAISA